MISEQFIVENLSCGGCVRTITRTLLNLPGVSDVEVDLETSVVSVSHEESTDRTGITATLKSLGYPEVSDTNGIMTQIRSVTSCLKGKFS